MRQRIRIRGEDYYYDEVSDYHEFLDHLNFIVNLLSAVDNLDRDLPFFHQSFILTAFSLFPFPLFISFFLAYI
jgi:hypothetical protein